MGMAKTGDERKNVVDMKAVLAEFVAMTLFIVIGCGAACGQAWDAGNISATRLLVAMAFGMGILVLAYTIGHHSGGQINCAVTFSLVLGGQVPWYQGLCNVVAQLLGSIFGAGLVAGMYPCGKDMTGSIGSNIIGEDKIGSAFLGEVLGTFILCYTVWETAVSPVGSAATGKNACIAIGFAVFLAHLILLPIDGCSINPTRSFGPPIVNAMRDCGTGHSKIVEKAFEHLWVMWVGPLLGGALAAAVQYPFRGSKSTDEVQAIKKTDGIVGDELEQGDSNTKP